MQRAISILLAASVVFLPLQSGGVVIRDDVAERAGGLSSYYDSADAYPFVAFLAMGCTGTLIDSRTIVTAGHCFGSQAAADATRGGDAFVSFKPDAAPPADADPASVLVHPGYDEAVFARRDVALVALDRPITSIEPVALAQSVTAEGQRVVLVGYGYSALASAPLDLIDDSRRRVGANALDYLGLASGLPAAESGDLPDDQPIVAVDVDHVPEDGDYSSLGTAVAQALEAGGAPGDSGGPLFLVLPDGSLLLVGVLTGGTLPVEGTEVLAGAARGSLLLGYGGVTLWQSVPFFHDWLQQNSFLRSISAVAGDGDWSSPDHWSGGTVPNNSEGYVDGGRARYYDVTLDQAGTTRLDMDATVDRLTVDNLLATLDILDDRQLTTEVGTTLRSGTLRVDGTLDSPWVELSGGTLGGGGLVATTSGLFQRGGTLSPGSTGAIGTLRVTGPLKQRGGRLLSELTVDDSDLLTVTGGTAELGGTLAFGLLGRPPASGARFTLVTGDDLDLSALADPEPVGAVTFDLERSPQALRVEVGRRPLTDLAVDPNQHGVAETLQAARDEELFSEAFYDSLDPLPAPLLARALDTLGGASTTAAATARMTSAQFLGSAGQRLAAVRSGGALGTANAEALRLLMSPAREDAVLAEAGRDPSEEQLFSRPRFSGPSDGLGTASASGPVFAAGRGSSLSPPLGDLRFGAWAQPYGLWAAREGDSRGDRYDTTLGGFAAGADYRIAGDGRHRGLLLGLSVGFAHADTRFRDLESTTTQRSYQAGLYGGWWHGPWSLDASVGVALNRYESQREIAFNAVRETAEGRYDGRELSAYVEARRRFEVGLDEIGLGETGFGDAPLEITPLAGLQFLRLETDSHRERGAGKLDLSVGGQQATSLRSGLGVSFAYPVALDRRTTLKPTLQLRWNHEFADTGSALDARFAAGGAGFTIRSDELGRDSALLGVGVTAEIGDDLDLSLGYDAQVQSGYVAHAVTSRLTFRF